METISVLLLISSIFLSAFFSGAEVAIISMSELRVMHLVEQKVRHAKTLLTLKKRPNRTLITILIGNNVVNIGGSALATKMAIDLFPGSAGVAIATAIMTFLILTFGEIAPKTFCVRNAKKIALAIAPMILFLSKLLAPFVWFFLQLTRLLARLTGASSDEPLVTEQEVRDIVRIGEKEGQIKSTEQEMIQKIFLFDDKEAEDVMTPRTDMFALDWNMTITGALPIIIDQDYSRVPVYDTNIDKIKGIVFARDLLRLISKGKSAHKLKDIAQDAFFVPEHQKIDVLLRVLQKEKTHMAIVVNEHGGIEGLITIEDILEEIVGEIFDESDDVERLIKRRGKNKWLILGKTSIEALNKSLKIDLSDEEEYNTIAGLIQHKLGKIPEEGDSCEIKKFDLSLQVSKMEGPMILEIIVERYHEDKNSKTHK